MVDGSGDCAVLTTDRKSVVAAAECARDAEVPEDDHQTALLKADSSGGDAERRADPSESDKAMQLSSIDISPITKIFNWLDE